MSVRSARIDRRELLIQAGERAFGRESYENVSTEHVARDAGVAQGLLFHYFGTKREFFLEVMRRITADQDAAYAANRHADPARWLATEIELFLDGVAQHPPARMTAGYAVYDDIRAMMEDAQDSAVQRLTERMGIQAPSPLLYGALYGWVAYTFAAGSRWVASGVVAKPQMVALLTAMLGAALQGLAQVEPASGIDPNFFGEPLGVDLRASY